MPERSGFPLPHASLQMPEQFWTASVILIPPASEMARNWLMEVKLHKDE
jgi:hypothetical protein